MFSFGIVLWEILTGEEPYANMHYGAIIGAVLLNFPNVLVLLVLFVCLNPVNAKNFNLAYCNTDDKLTPFFD